MLFLPLELLRQNHYFDVLSVNIKFIKLLHCSSQWRSFFFHHSELKFEKKLKDEQNENEHNAKHRFILGHLTFEALRLVLQFSFIFLHVKTNEQTVENRFHLAYVSMCFLVVDSSVVHIEMQ